ncbi:hypothetical protein [Streptomyces lydicus]|uniref:hypothetical protein n=1 Tax=Streptomyces lydicus TaxID=47763 RepID=UPI001F50D5B8|nr:hypothetical protein [Streptomyces lydicus]
MSARSALIVGASRNLGLGLATEYAQSGWDVIGTVRGSRRTALHDLAEASRGRFVVESLDTTKPEQVTALRERLTRFRQSRKITPGHFRMRSELIKGRGDQR